MKDGTKIILWGALFISVFIGWAINGQNKDLRAALDTQSVTIKQKEEQLRRYEQIMVVAVSRAIQPE